MKGFLLLSEEQENADSIFFLFLPGENFIILLRSEKNKLIILFP